MGEQGQHANYSIIRLQKLIESHLLGKFIEQLIVAVIQ